MKNPTRVSLNVELLVNTPYPSDVIEQCGKLAWNSEPAPIEARRDDFIRRLIDMGHTSVLEHVSVTFLVTGISRACSHQLVRHRIASYTQRSQRYVDEGEAYYVRPDGMGVSAEIVFERAMVMAFDAYRTLRVMGAKKEDARFVLPNACETQIAITMNFRELRHFFDIRCDKSAQWEIRAMATEMLKLITPEAWAVFEDQYNKFVVREVKRERG